MSYSVGAPQEGSTVLCGSCHAESIEQLTKREWFSYSNVDTGAKMLLPVLYTHLHCRVCKRFTQDKRTLKENRAVVQAMLRPNAHYWTNFPGSYCLSCGRLNPLERAMQEGHFNAIDAMWENTPEAARAHWDMARVDLFGCVIQHSVAIH